MGEWDKINKKLKKSKCQYIDKNIVISYGEKINCVYENKGMYDIEISKVFDIIKSDKLKIYTDYLRSIPEDEHKETRRDYKKANFPYVTFNGCFSYRTSKEPFKHLKKSSGLLVLDYDETYEGEETNKIRKKLIENEYVYAVFTSPSGALKFIVKIPEVKDDDEFKEYYFGIKNYFLKKSIILDNSCCDISRSCFLSYDPSLFINEDSKVFIDKGIDETKVFQKEIFVNKENIPKKEIVSTSKNTRSETEMSFVCKYIGQGFEKDVIFEKMKAFVKWNESSEQYKEKTYIKALEFINSKKSEFSLVNLSVENQAIKIIDRNPLYYDINKIWHYFNRNLKRWEVIDECGVITFIKKTYDLYGLSKSKDRATMLNALRDEARYRKPIDLSQFNIQIGKYIYDIRNDDVFEATEKYLPSVIINYDIDKVGEKEECPFIDNLFKEWLDEKKDVLYDIIAFAMSPRYFFDIAFWFVGKGENGKGLFTTIINKIVGDDNTTSQDLEILSDPKDRFTKGFLKGKLVCLLGDGNNQVLTHTKAIKTLTGCTDRVRGEIKGGGQVDFVNQAKLIGSFNTLPQTMDKTSGFYRRQHITEFKNNFFGLKNPLPNVPEWEYTVLAYKCFIRLKEIYKSNKIRGWGSFEERKEKYEFLSNPMGLFIDEFFEIDDDSYILPSVLYKMYNSFSITKGFSLIDYKEFEARLLITPLVSKIRKDIFIYEDKCWGKRNDMPDDIQMIPLETEKKNVIKGLKFKDLDNLDNLDTKIGVDTLYGTSTPKCMSKLSKLSKNNNIPSIKDKIYAFIGEKQLDIDIIIKNFEHLGKENVDKTIKDMLNDGDIYEIKPGVVKLL